MQLACWLIWLTGVYPLLRSLQANRRTSLLHAVFWTFLAWLAWGFAIALGGRWPEFSAVASCYLALCLTGCAGVAVLGARRPGALAWNFVVVCLLAVNLLPLAESLLYGGALRLGGLRSFCLVAPVLVGTLNYLPTRLGLAAIFLLLGCSFEFLALRMLPDGDESALVLAQMGWLAAAYVPWFAYWSLRQRAAARSRFDRLWLEFRDRFGFVWGQRLREQFGRSAAHAGWPVSLNWQGLRVESAEFLRQPGREAELETALLALRKRFVPEVEAIATDQK